MNGNNIGHHIAELRKAKGITQEALAQVIGVSAQAVSKWESGGSPDILLLPEIAEFFGVSIDRLFGRKAENIEDIGKAVSYYIGERLNDFEDEPWDVPDEIHADMLARAKKICIATFFGMVGQRFFEKLGISFHEIIANYSNASDNTSSLFGHYFSNQGAILASFARDFPYFLLAPEPPDGWRKGLLPQETYRAAFAALSDADVLHCLFTLHTKEPDSKFTMGYFVKMMGLSTEKAEKVVDTLIKYKFLSTSSIELDETRQTFYTYEPNAMFIVLLLLMQTFIERPSHYISTSSHRSKPLL